MDDVRLDWTTSHVVSWLERPCALFRFTVNARVGRIVQPIRIHVAQARNGSIATETLLLPRPQTLAQTPLGADAAAVADEQHADGQLEIDRRPADCAVEWLELPADVAQLDEAVDGAQQMIGGNVLLEAEASEHRLLPDLPLAHHGRALRHQED